MEPGQTKVPETTTPAAPVEIQPQTPGGGGQKPPAGKSALREWLETIVFALAIALLIRAFVVQVYLVEGESMEPTLHTSERLLVNKFLYRLRPPAPGEVVVVQDPAQPRRELIKRVIATTGETVEIRNKIVYIDGKPLREDYISTLHLSSVVDQRFDPVPAGHVFVMGDNRGRSLDSRIIGPIPLSKIEGKAFFLFWPPDRLFVTGLTVDRTFTK